MIIFNTLLKLELFFCSKKVISRVLTRFIGGGVHAGVFALQFIDWWYNEENQSNVRLVIKFLLI